MKIYRHIDKLPVWNYYQVIRERDLRYLIVSDDYGEIQNIDKADVEKLNQIWQEINYQFSKGSVHLQLIRLKTKTWECFLNYLTDISQQQKYHDSFADFKKEYDKQNSDVFLDNYSFLGLYGEKISTAVLDKFYHLRDKKYKSFTDLYLELKTLLTFEELIFIRLYIVDYLKQDEIEFDLIDEKINIELTLSIHIDVFKVSINEYMKYKERAKNIINKEKSKQNGRR